MNPFRPSCFTRKLFLFYSLFLNVLWAQKPLNAQQIIDTHFQKTGGYSKWMNVQTIVLKGKATLKPGVVYPIEIYLSKPNLVRTQMAFEKGKFIILEGFDGSHGYVTNTENNRNVKVPHYQPKPFENQLLNYSKKGYAAKLLPNTTIGKSVCYRVQLIKNNEITTYYFDTKTFYVIREEDSEERQDFFNYKPYKGLVMAYGLISLQKIQNSTVTINFESIVVNNTITNNIFKF